MDYFNINSFILGILLFTFLYLSNIVYSLLCVFYKIKIVEFSVFFNPWFSLHNVNIGGTKFILGWLPLGSYIKPLGMSATDEEKKKFSTPDLPFTFFTKPKYLRTLFNTMPWIIFIVVLFVSFVLFSSKTGIGIEFQKFIEFIKIAFKTMFGDKIMRDSFVELTKEITFEKNIVLFAFVLLILYWALILSISKLIEWFTNEKTKSKLRKAITYALYIIVYWVLLWQIPKFVFSFFSFKEILIFISNFMVGMLSIGLFCYFITVFFLKVIYKLNNSNEKSNSSLN